MLTAVGYAVGPIIINRKLADLPPIGVVTASSDRGRGAVRAVRGLALAGNDHRAGGLVDRRASR